MSLANKLEIIYTNLDAALEDINSAIVAKGLSGALSIGAVGNKIRAIESGGSNILLNALIEREYTENFIIPDNITRIGKNAFCYYESLQSVVIPNSTISIGDEAFFNCSNLKSITIPDSVETIGAKAFSYCLAITNIIIPDSVISVGNKAFFACSRLADIYFYSITPPTVSFEEYSIPPTTTIHVPVGSGDVYKSATNWSTFADKIVEDIIN